MKKVKRSYEKRKRTVAYFFLIPWLFGALFFFIRPLVDCIRLSFSRTELNAITGYTLHFVGIQNYVDAFTKDPDFLRLMVSSMQMLFLHVPIIIIFSLFISIILNQKFLGRTLIRSVFFLPVIIASGVVMSIINGDVYAGNMMANAGSSQMLKSEFLNNFLLESGFTQEFSQTFTGIVDSIFDLIWKSGVQILIFLAGLQTISVSMYEAAKVEGATAWESFWKITFPMISPITLLNLIYTIVDLSTEYTNPVMAHANQVANSIGLNLELSSAMSYSYFAVVLVLLGAIYLLVNRKVFYQT